MTEFHSTQAAISLENIYNLSITDQMSASNDVKQKIRSNINSTKWNLAIRTDSVCVWENIKFRNNVQLMTVIRIMNKVLNSFAYLWLSVANDDIEIFFPENVTTSPSVLLSSSIFVVRFCKMNLIKTRHEIVYNF